MKVARFAAPGDRRIEDAPEPTPADDGLKVKVHLELIASGAVPVTDLITRTMPLTDVLAAIDTVNSVAKGEAGKVTRQPGEGSAHA